MTEVLDLLQATIAAHVAPDARVLEARQREGGEQGLSAARLRYYDVAYMRAGVAERATLVIKEARWASGALWRGWAHGGCQCRSATRPI
jgi:hypothetical protein